MRATILKEFATKLLRCSRTLKPRPNTTSTRRSSWRPRSNCWRGCSARRWNGFLSKDDNLSSPRPLRRLLFEAKEDHMANQPNPDVKVVDDKVAEANERVGRIRQEAGSGADQTKAKGNGDDDIAQASLSGR